MLEILVVVPCQMALYIDTGTPPLKWFSYRETCSDILILAGDIRSRSWHNIGGTYGMCHF